MVDRLRVALFIKGSESNYRREDRNMGYWSYPVPEFEWRHFAHPGERVDLAKYKDFDLIFHEDAGLCTYANKSAGPPVVYLAIDSTLSDAHYKKRFMQAEQADLVLVDHDQLERFRGACKRVKRLAYCVNDLVFKPLTVDKTTDVSYHCSSGARKNAPGGIARNELRQWLSEWCNRCGYSFRSGILPLEDYATSMAASRIVVNLPRTIINRPHRVFDTMACRTALLTAPIPLVKEDGLKYLEHYLVWHDNADLSKQLDRLFDYDEWLVFANNGYKLVKAKHTWEIRARQLRDILNRELGI